MGYTHYWRLKKGKYYLTEKCLEDIKEVIEEHKDIIQYEDDDNRKPIAKINEIRFNGIGKDGHETFSITVPPKEDKISKFQNGFMFNFCKTARKDYDIVVCKILLILKAHLKGKMILGSDGFSNYELSFDGCWNEAIEKIKDMGYKINASVYSRDNGESPYYDCEIKEVMI